MDREIMDKGIFTFSRICVEINLRRFLPYRVHLTHQDFEWTQWLEFKNIASKCQIFHQKRALAHYMSTSEEKNKKKTSKAKMMEIS